MLMIKSIDYNFHFFFCFGLLSLMNFDALMEQNRIIRNFFRNPSYNSRTGHSVQEVLFNKL